MRLVERVTAMVSGGRKTKEDDPFIDDLVGKEEERLGKESNRHGFTKPKAC